MKKFRIAVPTTRSISVWPLVRDPATNEEHVKLLRRGAKHSIGKFEVVTGKVDDESETHEEAAIREVFEESGAFIPAQRMIHLGGFCTTGDMFGAPYVGDIHMWDHQIYVAWLRPEDNFRVNEPHTHSDMAEFPLKAVLSERPPCDLVQSTWATLPFVRHFVNSFVSYGRPIFR